MTTRIHWTNVDSDDIATDAIINPGESGGGIFSEKGYLIGIIRATSSVADGVAYAVSAEQLRELIPELRSGVKR